MCSHTKSAPTVSVARAMGLVYAVPNGLTGLLNPGIIRYSLPEGLADCDRAALCWAFTHGLEPRFRAWMGLFSYRQSTAMV